jgi:Ca-activated chloride channel family protein
MNFKEIFDKEKITKEKYEYFLSLGYGEKASTVMAILKYGEEETAGLISLFSKENVLDRIYDWLVECNFPAERLSMGIKSYIMDNRDRLPDNLKQYFRPVEEIMFEERSRGFGGAVAGAGMPMMGLGNAMMSTPMMMKAPAPGMVGGAMLAATGMFSAPGQKISPEMLATDSYDLIEEIDAKSVLTAPTSTFRMTTSTASVGVLLNQIRNGRNINMSQVRIEELLNYFDYKKSPVSTTSKFHITTELMDKSEDRKLLYINVEADNTPKEHQNIVFLLDTSGSMSSNKDVTLETLATIVSKLKENDVLSLVTYSTDDHTVFTNRVVNGSGDKEDLMGEILGIVIDGCTNGSAGIETAYALGEKTYKDGWSNQVILITDGDLNFGINSKDGLKNLILDKKKTGMFLSVIGTGLYNYKDDKLEVLSKHGNGTYCVVNDLEDVKESINNKYVSLTNIVAKDVKAQVEFNPKYVKKYRLLGYENRTLNHEDFRNDAVISEPYGAGGHGVALYELYMGDATEKPSEELKYQRLAPNEYKELGTVSVRFKAPLSDESDEVSEIIPIDLKYTDNSKLAYLLYCISEVLRGSKKLDKNDYKYLVGCLAADAYKSLTDTKLDALASLISKINIDEVTKLSKEENIDYEKIAKNIIIDSPGTTYTPNAPMTGFMGMFDLNKINPNVNQVQNNNGMMDGDYMTYKPTAPANTSNKTEINENNEWKCPICGESKENRGNFCCTCGAPRPKDVWKCNCGCLNTGKFCNDCGAMPPMAVQQQMQTPATQWTCSCGAKNTTKFCTECGSPRPTA